MPDADVLRRLDTLEEKVLIGNGDKPLLVRVAILEDSQKRWEKIATKLALAAVTALVTIMGHLAWEAIAPHFH